MPTNTACRRHYARGQTAQSLVETAIALPVLLLLILGITDLGRAFYYREAVANSARQALRVAVSADQHSNADAICAGTGGGPIAISNTTTIGSASGPLTTIANEAGLESSSNGTPSGSAIAGARITVTFHCLNGAAITNATADGSGPTSVGSDSVKVTIVDTFSVITPFISNVVGPTFPISVSAFERSEY